LSGKDFFFRGLPNKRVSPKWPARTLKHLWGRPHGNEGIEGVIGSLQAVQTSPWDARVG
jgi:hypothetical protein